MCVDHPDPESVALSPSERALVVHGLELLLSCADRDEQVTRPARDLLHRLHPVGER